MEAVVGIHSAPFGQRLLIHVFIIFGSGGGGCCYRNNINYAHAKLKNYCSYKFALSSLDAATSEAV